MLKQLKKNQDISFGKKGTEVIILEYRKIDFYGPFLILRMEKDLEYENVNVYPKKVKIETAEVSASDFDLLVEAASEIYKMVGKFKMFTDYFNAEITTDEKQKIEELMLNKFKNLQLF